MGSSLFRPFEKLVEIQVLDKTFQVPEKNTLLRALQFLNPTGVSYGRFCWNQECQLCRVSYVMKGREEKPPREILACKVWAPDGMRIVQLSGELRWALRTCLKDS